MYRTKTTPDPIFTDVLKLELASIEPSLAGPKRPQDRVALKEVKSSFIAVDGQGIQQGNGGGKEFRAHRSHSAMDRTSTRRRKGRSVEARLLGHGDVVIAAITSCTNTSNPSVMVAAGLLARKAVAKGLTVKPWVKTSLAPGSQVVADYLREVRPAEGSRRARLQSGRLRLHHLHRQFRPAAGGNLRGDQQERSGRRRGALGQPQFRRPRQRRRARQLSRLAAAGRRLCDRRLDVCRSRQGAARRRQEGQEGLPQGHLADQPRDQLVRSRKCITKQVFAEEIRQRVQGRRHLGARSRSRAA